MWVKRTDLPHKAVQASTETEVLACLTGFCVMFCRLAGCGTQSLSNLLWACAVMGIRDQPFLAAAQAATIAQKGELNNQVSTLHTRTNNNHQNACQPWLGMRGASLSLPG